MLKMGIRRGGDAERVRRDLGGTCHNDKPGLNEGDDGGSRYEDEGGEAGWKARPATITSQAMCVRI